MSHQPLENYMDNNLYLAPPTFEDDLFLNCVTEMARKYNINLSDATMDERRFVFDRAEEMLRDKVAV